MEELEEYRNQLQRAFDTGNVEEIMKLLKRMKELNVEIPFTVEGAEYLGLKQGRNQ